MSEPIKAGDLVQIIHQCCAVDSEIGQIFTVEGVHDASYKCWGCGYRSKGLAASDVLYPFAQEYGAVPIEWLKRIPPLSELEGEKRDEKLTEPA